jgi:hypothetical protein
MKTPPVRVLFVLSAAAAALFSSAQGNSWYPGLIATAVFVLAAFLRQGSEDTRILILAAGEVLVIAAAISYFFAGFIVQCAVIGAVLVDGRVPAATGDRTLFVLYCIAALMGAIIFDRSNQVLLPFLVVTALVAAATVAFVGVQEMRERRMYAGGNP